jgi:hypothetical protein
MQFFLFFFLFLQTVISSPSSDLESRNPSPIPVLDAPAPGSNMDYGIYFHVYPSDPDDSAQIAETKMF